ncbi:MAG: xylose isomerase [Planctomycetota bacterium]|nr:MAG: xylose isomerase [Planctomycetota bacterium]
MARFGRRQFLQAGAVAAGAGWAVARMETPLLAASGKEPLFKISLAEWSFHRTLQKGDMDNLDFPKAAKDLGIEAVEYVNQFFKDKAEDEQYLGELEKRCKDEGITSVLIMCDGEGNLGDPDNAKRKQAVKNHQKWVHAAKRLGCHSIRVNAHSEGSREEQAKLAADGLRQLSEYAAPHKIGVIVENHGGLSSHGDWLAGVIKSVGLENCGTLPDFGNFYEYDRYQGVKELMPFAKGVSAKSHEFDDQGNEVRTDYRRMMEIVLDAGYHGYVGIEWEGDQPGEREGILLTKQLLERVRDELSAKA